MPIYEYQCDGCDYKFEHLQKLTDGLLKVCPECNEEKLRKLVSAAAFQLKGTGWYVTDFKDKKPKQKNEAKDDKTAKSDKDSNEKPKSTESKESKSEKSGADSTSTSKKTDSTKSSD